MHILIIDDHQLFIEGLRHVLVQAIDALAITEAHNADEALQSLEDKPDFDLILLDLSLPGLDGIDLLKAIMSRKLWIPIAVLSAQEDVRIIKQAIDAGALGFIPKSHNSQSLIDALKKILNGEIYLPEELRQRVAKISTQREKETTTGFSRYSLTRRQFEVLGLLAKGYSNKDIAKSLYLTENTVKSHISAIFQALEVSNRIACIRCAEENGLLISAAAD